MNAYRILVVDDELPNLESLERILKSDGATVELCQNPHEALSRIRQGSLDVMLTDLRMDSMDGLSLLEAAKALRHGSADRSETDDADRGTAQIPCR